ncbi:cob(I)yrinic acid a,c-diamide adenosyltransferase [bacterium]|nr:cob(I)yrinic acid a,c-diamide adenosyltransferase [bacterium]
MQASGRPAPQRGLVQIFTGNGKGKTTAALGTAMRAAGHGYKVFIIQFMKGMPHIGEALLAGRTPNITLVQAGGDHFVDLKKPSDQDRAAARSGLDIAKSAMNEGYDVLILDEILLACGPLIPLDEVLQLVKTKPFPLELILTGRNAHPDLVAAADLVSEIREVKHPFRSGIPARKGIDY